MRIRWGARKITGIFKFIAVIWHSEGHKPDQRDVFQRYKSVNTKKHVSVESIFTTFLHIFVKNKTKTVLNLNAWHQFTWDVPTLSSCQPGA